MNQNRQNNIRYFKATKQAKAYPVADYTPGYRINLKDIQKRNTYRKEMKLGVSEGPWFVKTNVYRAYGTRYEVLRHVPPRFPGDHPKDEVIVPEGTIKKDKDFIAFARSDAPENDIDTLVGEVIRLSTLEKKNLELQAYIDALEKQNSDLQDQVETLTAERDDARAEYQAYIQRTEEVHVNAGILREALEFYANPDHWNWHLLYNPIMVDSGKNAQRALEITDSGQEVLEKLHKLRAVMEAAGDILKDHGRGQYSPQAMAALAERFNALNQE